MSRNEQLIDDISEYCDICKRMNGEFDDYETIDAYNVSMSKLLRRYQNGEKYLELVWEHLDNPDEVNFLHAERVLNDFKNEFSIDGQQWVRVKDEINDIQYDFESMPIESGYEYFEPGLIVRENGRTIYERNARSVEPYHNEVYILGDFKNEDELLDYLDNKWYGCLFRNAEEPHEIINDSELKFRWENEDYAKKLESKAKADEIAEKRKWNVFKNVSPNNTWLTKNGEHRVLRVFDENKPIFMMLPPVELKPSFNSDNKFDVVLLSDLKEVSAKFDVDGPWALTSVVDLLEIHEKNLEIVKEWAIQHSKTDVEAENFESEYEVVSE